MIHTRNQLLNWMNDNIDDPVLNSALRDGEVEVLGGFAPLPTSHNNGWMVKVVSPFRVTHLLAVAMDRKNMGRIYWFNAPLVNWSQWIGDTKQTPLYQGDNPSVYKANKFRNERFSNALGSYQIHLQTDRDHDHQAGVV